MKRILSIVLTAAMLLSMLAVAAVAQTDHSVIAGTTEKNVFSYATDKDTYAPGETVTVTVSAESFWGDPDMIFEDDLDGVTMGCYGVSIFTVSPVFSTEIFTVATAPKLVSSSTIENWDYRSATMPTKNNMNADGYGPVMVTLTQMTNDDGDAYLNFYGSGDIYTVKFTINEGVATGEYPIYFGNYMKGDGKNDNDFYVNGIGPLDYNPIVDAYGQEIDSSYHDFGGPLMVNVVNDSETGSGSESEPPVVEDPMSFNFTVDTTNAYVAGDTVSFNVAVLNNEGLTADDMAYSFSFDNTQLKLIGATTAIEGLAVSTLNVDAINTQSTEFADLGKTTTFSCFVDGAAEVTEDVTLLTLTFEVLATAEAGDVTVGGGIPDAGISFADATITVAGDHAHAFEDVVVEPTCREAGTEDKVCSCGLSYRIATTPATGHTVSTDPKDTTSVAATCTNRGYTTTNCAVCGLPASTVYTDALGHAFAESDVEVSCTSDGYHLKACTREGCGYTEKSDIVPALAHKLENGESAYGESFVSTKPTTNSIGYMGRICSLCGSLWEYETIDMLEVYFGDVNMDGKISLVDVATILKNSAKWDDLYFSIENADVNHDGRCNTVDASKLMKYIAGWPGIDLAQGSTVIQ